MHYILKNSRWKATKGIFIKSSSTRLLYRKDHHTIISSRHQQPTHQFNHVEQYLCEPSLTTARLEKGQKNYNSSGITQHNQIGGGRKGLDATRSLKNQDVGDATVRWLMLLRVVDQQGIDVVSLSTEEKLCQLRRQQV